MTLRILLLLALALPASLEAQDPAQMPTSVNSGLVMDAAGPEQRKSRALRLLRAGSELRSCPSRSWSRLNSQGDGSWSPTLRLRSGQAPSTSLRAAAEAPLSTLPHAAERNSSNDSRLCG